MRDDEKPLFSDMPEWKWPFLMRPQPYQEESPLGYVLRLAHVNKYALSQRQGNRFNFFGLAFGEVVRLGTRGCWVRSSGVEQPDAEWQLHYADAFAKACSANAYRTKICPRCLAEKGHRRADWDLPLSFACDVHRIKLVEKCPRCARDITYRDGSLYLCRCGADFRRAPTNLAERWVNSFNRFFLPWRLGRRGGAHLNAAHELVAASLVEWLTDCLIWLCYSNYRHHSTLREHSASLGHAADEWFRGHPGLMTQLIGLATKNEYSKLQRHLATWRVGQDHGLTNDSGSIGVFRGFPSHDLRPPSLGLVPLELVAQALQLDWDDASELFHKGVFRSATIALRRPPDYRHAIHPYWVCQTELSCAEQFYGSTEGEHQAARFLGCSPTILVRLVKDGYVRAVVHAFSPEDRRYRRRDLQSLLRKLTHRSEVVHVGEARGLITLEEALRRASESSPSAPIMRLLLRKKAALFVSAKPPVRLSSFFVLASEVLDRRRCGRPRRVRPSGSTRT